MELSYAEYAALPTIKFTREAFEILTEMQHKALCQQIGDSGYRKLSVFKAFELPEGYVYVVRHTYNPNAEIRIGTIHMGIAPDGSISS